MFLLDWIYPPKCMACRALLPPQVPPRAWLCAQCKPLLVPLQGPFCPRCGSPLPEDAACTACRGRPFAFDFHRAGFPYDGVLQELLHQMKFRSYKQYAQGLGHILAENCADWKWMQSYDFLVPVPLHPAKKRSRGYNQAAVLAKPLALALDIPLAEGLIQRVRNTPPQSGLSPSEREKNLMGAFAYNNRKKLDIAHPKILLLDDIFTTGTTMHACAQVLKNQGAAGVACISLSIALKKS